MSTEPSASSNCVLSWWIQRTSQPPGVTFAAACSRNVGEMSMPM